MLTDTHPKVQSAGQTALQQVSNCVLKSVIACYILRFVCVMLWLFQVGSVIKNPEIASLVPTLLMGLSDPNDHTKYSLDILLQVCGLYILVFTSQQCSFYFWICPYLCNSYMICCRQLSSIQLMPLRLLYWCQLCTED